jgi:glycogen synthase
VFIGENALDILYDQRNDIHHTAVQFGFKIRKLRAGIDYSTFSPETDSDIHKMFSATSINCKVENKLFVQRYLYLKENADIPLVALYPDTNKDIYTMYIRELIRCDIQLILISNNISHSTLKSLSDKCVCIRDNSAETLKNIFSVIL